MSAKRRPKAMPTGAVVSVNFPGDPTSDTYCRIVAAGTDDDSIRAALDELLSDRDEHAIGLGPRSFNEIMQPAKDRRDAEAEAEYCEVPA